MNGSLVSRDDMRVFTNASLILAFLDVLYEDFTFADVKDEVAALHSELHQLPYLL